MDADTRLALFVLMTLAAGFVLFVCGYGPGPDTAVHPVEKPPPQRAQARTVDAAIGASLEWLDSSLRHYHMAGDDYEKGLYGLASLPLIAAGSTHIEGPRREAVLTGLIMMTNIQAAEGDVYESGTRWMYSQAIAVMALSRVRAKARGEGFKNEAQDAARFLKNTWNEKLGWEYFEGDGSSAGASLLSGKPGMQA
jgi:hypothetical protein